MIRDFFIIGVLTFGSFSFAAEDAAVPAAQEWSFKGPLGTFDRAQLQRGFQVYTEVCASCHAINLLSYRNLSALGFNEAQIKAIAATHTVTDGPNDEGEMFERPALPSDRFVAPFRNEKAARAANNGAYPPDLSLITKARAYGPDYLYGLLIGYQPHPPGFKVLEGLYYNLYFPGHQIAMPNPLSDGLVTYSDGTPNSASQMAKDVTAFLAWVSEPEMEDRKRMGVSVLIYLTIFTALMFFLMKKIWSRVE